MKKILILIIALFANNLYSQYTLWGSGANAGGNLGNGKHDEKVLVPIKIGNDKEWLAIAAGGTGYSMGIKSDSSLWAWGNTGFIPNSDSLYYTRAVPNLLFPGTKWKSIDINEYNVALIKSDGTLWVKNKATIPDSLFCINNDNDWKTVKCGQHHWVAIKNNGTLWAWGGNDMWQVGDQTQIDRKLPVKISNDSNWINIDCSSYASLATNTNGNLFFWGYQTLENNKHSYYDKPSIFLDTLNTHKIICNGFVFYAIDSKNNLWSWGAKDDKYYVESYLPKKVIEGYKFNNIYGSNNIFLTDSVDFLIGFGDNFWGQLGDGTEINKGACHATILTGKIHDIACSGTHTLYLIEPTTDINEIYNNSFDVYPNPTTDILNFTVNVIDNPSVKMELFTMDGKLIKSNSFGILSSGFHKLETSVSELPNGVYLLNVIIGEKRISNRFEVAK